MNRLYYFLFACLCVSSLNAQQTPRPNIVLIMVDDMGYSDIGCYGSEIPTPNIDRLASEGVRFSSFYNGARCCPTRAALMTGLHPHQAGVGHMTEDPQSEGRYDEWNNPAYQGYLNRECVTMAEALSESGYHTYMTGKWHLGYHERDQWPLQRGFERYYGILPGASSYLKPSGDRGITLDNEQLPAPEGDYYTTDAFTDYALKFMQSRTDDDPFFLYLAYNAPHWPLQAKEEDIAKFEGKYMVGWDSLRTARYEKQLSLNLFEEAPGLPPRDDRVRSWDKLRQNEKEGVAYRMAVYAAQLSAVDQNVGRVIDYLETSGELDNTLIIFLSDNGACAEFYDELGSGSDTLINNPVYSAVSYGIGWANLSNTPFRQYKTTVYQGGISTPLIFHWPDAQSADAAGTIVHDVGYLPDMMPTVLAAARAEYPKTFHGGTVMPPLTGNVLLPVLEQQTSAGHDYLFWEHEDNCGVRQGDWMAIRRLEQSQWELFNLATDRTEGSNVAAQHPDRIKEMAERWEAWALETGAVPKRHSR